MLYLENNLASHVFTPARIAVLELLSSQAAISLDNARLYAELINENRDRQKAEEALRASEERWRSLFENVPVGVALTGPDGRYVAANPAFQQNDRLFRGRASATARPPTSPMRTTVPPPRRSSRRAPRVTPPRIASRSATGAAMAV